MYIYLQKLIFYITHEYIYLYFNCVYIYIYMFIFIIHRYPLNKVGFSIDGYCQPFFQWCNPGDICVYIYIHLFQDTNTIMYTLHTRNGWHIQPCILYYIIEKYIYIYVTVTIMYTLHNRNRKRYIKPWTIESLYFCFPGASELCISAGEDTEPIQ